MDSNGEILFKTPMQPRIFTHVTVSASQHLGKRKNQEDRFVFSPDYLGSEYGIFCVFDGTVGYHASEYAANNFTRELFESKQFQQFHSLTFEEQKSNPSLLEEALLETYAAVDKGLLNHCHQYDYHYSASTSVTCLIHYATEMLFTAHVGDSHAVIAQPHRTQMNPDKWVLHGRSITPSHKPDDPEERDRIEASGGSLVYLKKRRPFLRGGDFFKRKLAMQLNYSRAFGGKDLKMYGLSCVPSISSLSIATPVDPNQKGICCLLLGTDGIWDVLEPNMAVREMILQQIEYEGHLVGEERKNAEAPSAPADKLVQLATEGHAAAGTHDNMTAIVVFLTKSISGANLA